MIYVTADIHGNKENFKNILKQINLRPEDTLYILGDVIDRFPDGIELIQYIMQHDNIKMLLGNHEFMMLECINHPEDDFYLEMWIGNGGMKTMESITSLPQNERNELINYVESLPLNIPVAVNNKKFLLVHASPEITQETIRGTGCPDIDSYANRLGYSSAKEYAVWDRDIYTYSLVSKYIDNDITVICGHTPTEIANKNGMMEINVARGLINIDCGCGWGKENGGRLACLRLDDMQVFYSDEPLREVDIEEIR